MARNTARNRIPGAFAAYIIPTSRGGTETELPDMTGSTLNWGTSGGTGVSDWLAIPSFSESVEWDPYVKLEDFEAAEFGHVTDVDVIAVGCNHVSGTIKETDLDALNLGLSEALLTEGSGTPSFHILDHPLTNADLPELRLAVVGTGPGGGWGQVYYFPHVKQTKLGLPKTGKGKIRTRDLEFRVLVEQQPGKEVGQGRCFRIFECDPAE